jgi:hypothetical protein
MASSCAAFSARYFASLASSSRSRSACLAFAAAAASFHSSVSTVARFFASAFSFVRRSAASR